MLLGVLKHVINEFMHSCCTLFRLNTVINEILWQFFISNWNVSLRFQLHTQSIALKAQRKVWQN